jgi:hypothetical protein
VVPPSRPSISQSPSGPLVPATARLAEHLLSKLSELILSLVYRFGSIGITSKSEEHDGKPSDKIIAAAGNIVFIYLFMIIFLLID